VNLIASEAVASEGPRLEHLRGLLAVAEALRAGGELTPLLEAIARTVADSLGFATVVVVLHRPAWDDFEVVVVHGAPAARELLLGQRSTLRDWSAVLAPRFEAHGTYFVPHGTVDWEDERPASYIPPPGDHADAPGGWHPEDALLVPLRAGDGTLLGIVSVDEPADGRVPSPDQREVLAALAAHAAVAVEHANATAAGEGHRAAVEHLLRVSAELAGQTEAEDALATVCAGIRDALGFEKVAVLLPHAETGDLRPVAGVGFGDEVLAAFPRVGREAFAAVLDPALEREGCVLLTRAEAWARTPPVLHGAYSSERNGRGPRAWQHHWLMVALRDREGEILGVLWADDPADRLLPTRERLHALRAFANQAMEALNAVGQLEHMRRLADHDPLTGLRNRRSFEPGLEAAAAEHGRVALLVCDLDHFKRVNDSLGHEAGDEVLRRFAEVLRAGARHADLPTRLGGEEFALVLPGADTPTALAVGERLRRAVHGEFAGFPVPVSVSVGVAVCDGEREGAAAITRAAHRALYAAKRLGRDRCVVYEPHLAEILSSPGDGASREQLAAAILLAETLDLRDGGTARHCQTVARLAEGIGRELDWAPARVERVRAAGLLHDIGKLGISDAILHKADGLAPEEWGEIRRHPEVGARILEHANLGDIAGWVLAHHERIDGRGYPHGLRGEDIPGEARVLAVADAYEAMVADRPYHVGLAAADARAELERGAGQQFDAEVVAAFGRALDREPALAEAA